MAKYMSASDRRFYKQVKMYMLCGVLICAIVALSIAIYYKINPPDTGNIVTDTINDFTESIGGNPEDLTGPVRTESGMILEGTLAKTVKQYRTLAEAEEDMGFYLGLHNTLECNPNYQLVGMYNIGQGAWYQAVFEDARAEEAVENLGDDITSDDANVIAEEYPSITLKVSKESDLGGMLSAYEKTRDDCYIDKIDNVNIYLYSKGASHAHDEETGEIVSKINIAAFEVPNGKKYTLYSSYGISEKVLYPILEELISNLKIMEDWVD